MKHILIELGVLGFCRSFYKTEKYARVERTTESLDIKYKFHRAKYLRETSSLIRWGGGRTGPLDTSLNSYLHSAFALKEMKNSIKGLQEVVFLPLLPVHLISKRKRIEIANISLSATGADTVLGFCGPHEVEAQQSTTGTDAM